MNIIEFHDFIEFPTPFHPRMKDLPKSPKINLWSSPHKHLTAHYP